MIVKFDGFKGIIFFVRISIDLNEYQILNLWHIIVSIGDFRSS